METLTQTRQIDIPGVHNMRDTGGYPAAGGCTTRWGTLFRSARLHALGPSSMQMLVDMGIRTVVDLRGEGEIARAPDTCADWPGIAYKHIPLTPAHIRTNGDRPANLEAQNERYLEDSSEQIAMVLRVLARPNAFPAIVHCTAGKDRTGIITALLLALVGVPDNVIADDYLLSLHGAAPVLEALRVEGAASGWDLDHLERMLECRPEVITHTLDVLRRRHGGVERYLSQAGVWLADLQALRAALLEPAR